MSDSISLETWRRARGPRASGSTPLRRLLSGAGLKRVFRVLRLVLEVAGRRCALVFHRGYRIGRGQLDGLDGLLGWFLQVIGDFLRRIAGDWGHGVSDLGRGLLLRRRCGEQ